MYIGNGSRESWKLPSVTEKLSGGGALNGLNPVLAMLSPITAILSERKKKALSGLGDEPAASTASSAGAGSGSKPNPQELAAIIGVGVLVTAAVVVSVGVPAYHGYKRNRSVGWGVWWGLMGALFPAPTIAVSIAQGYAKPEKKRR